MKLHQILIVIISLFFTITSYSATTEVSLTISIGMSSPIPLQVGGSTINADLLDGNYAHRYNLYVNNQLIHHFEPLTAANSIPEGIGYTSTVVYTGSIICDSSIDLRFQVELESDADLDSTFDQFTPKSGVYPFRVPCLSVPQNFIIVF